MRHLQLKYMVYYSICACVNFAFIFVLFGFCKLSTFWFFFLYIYEGPLDWVYWLYSHYRRWYCYDFCFMLTPCIFSCYTFKYNYFSFYWFCCKCLHLSKIVAFCVFVKTNTIALNSYWIRNIHNIWSSTWIGQLVHEHDRREQAT